MPYTYLGTPYTTPPGEFTVLGQGDIIVFRGWISPAPTGWLPKPLLVWWTTGLAESKSSAFEPDQNTDHCGWALNNCSPDLIWPPCPFCHPVYGSRKRLVMWAWWLAAVCRCLTTSPQSVEAVTTNCDKPTTLAGCPVLVGRGLGDDGSGLCYKSPGLL